MITWIYSSCLQFYEDFVELCVGLCRPAHLPELLGFNLPQNPSRASALQHLVGTISCSIVMFMSLFAALKMMHVL